MSLKPGRKGVFDISRIYHPGYRNGFKGYGNDKSHDSKDIIYFGDMFNLSILAFKAFIDTLEYDISKEVDDGFSTENGISNFKAYSGKIGIKLGFSVPSHSRNESKNNLAKIQHLQMSIRQSRNPNEGSGLIQSHEFGIQYVFFKNLINNGNLNYSLSRGIIKKFSQLRKIGLPCFIEEVVYEPDFSAGFHEIKGEIFAKNYKVSLTLNPVTSQETNARYFFHPFNNNGAYNRSDSIGFPFLLQPGVGKSECADTRLKFGDKDRWLSPNSFNSWPKNTNGLIYISLPLHPDFIEKDNTLSSTDERTAVHRSVVFDPFLDSFSRNFSKEVVLEQDKRSTFSQTIQQVTNKAVTYSFSFNVPSKDANEAMMACAKIQYLMRMFYSRKKYLMEEIIEGSDAVAESVSVYIHSFIEKGNSNKKRATNGKQAFERSALLKFKDLTIQIDVAEGFFRFGSRLYPKNFKISIELVDDIQDNYRKQMEDGTPESSGTDISIDLFGSPEGQVLNTYDGFLFPSKTKYWSP